MKDIPMNDWSPDWISKSSQWEAELTGMIGSYNLLAADYNSRMANINYAFTNAGTLPAGESQVLPREYRQYINE